jgi:hypothetical protein
VCFFWEKYLFCAVSQVRSAFFYFWGQRTVVFERVARPILCMDASELDSYVIGSIG